MTLAEFLLARIAEDETDATRALDQPLGYRWRTLSWLTEANRDHGLRHSPARILAECEAKRLILAAHIGPHVEAGNPPCEVLRALALPYADHPDYRNEWLP